VRGYARVILLFCGDVAAIVFAEVLLRLLTGTSALQSFETANLLASLVGRPLREAVAPILVGLLLVGTYAGGDARRDKSRITSGALLGLLIMSWHTVWSTPDALGAQLLMAAAVVSSLVTTRALLDALLKRLLLGGVTKLATLLVGDASVTQRERQELLEQHRLGMLPVAELDPASGPNAYNRRAEDHRLADLHAIIAEHSIDTILLCGQLEDHVLHTIMNAAQAAGCHVMAPSRAYKLSNLTPSVSWRHGVPMVELTRPGLHGHDLVLKRILDIVVASIALIFAAPVMLLTALAVRVTSPGPAIFRQRRVGYAGHTFNIFKFRTMYADAEQRLAALQQDSLYGDGKLFKMKQDPRVTPLGRFLRKSSIDELPQLFNVLRGEMSLVGPRPALFDQEDLLELRRRSGADTLRPGISGWAQVRGRDELSVKEKAALDEEYLQKQSFLFDLWILILTVDKVFKSEGIQH
jgi:exopolysaccharide biosynthesis polyprenyl glycosylphosphotransferase